MRSCAAHTHASIPLSHPLPLRARRTQTWSLIFVDSERLEYDFDTFDTDLQATCEGCKEDMCWADVQKFFDENL